VRGHLASVLGSWALRTTSALALAVVIGACSGGSAATSSGDWPDAGQVRAALTSRFGYSFRQTSDNWEYMKGGLAIDLPAQDNDVADVSVTIYNAPYDQYQTDIDNVFAVLDPSATGWVHQQLAASKQTDTVNNQTTAAGGAIKFSWDKSIPVVNINFVAKARPRQQSS
jgi:hypothetical protein